MHFSHLRAWTLSTRQRFDLEMLLNHGFAPLTGFLSQADYENVLQHIRLSNQQLWPMPITLDVTEDFAQKLIIGEKINLLDKDNTLLARMTITDKWCPNKKEEAEKIFGTQDCKHPGVDYLYHQAGTWYLGGPIEGIQLPKHYDFTELRHTPLSIKELFLQLGWTKIIGFQTRNPMHRAHLEITLRAAEQTGGAILIHPVVGLTKAEDIHYASRVRCYQKILPYYPQHNAQLSLLPLAMRMAGPREAIWHALIRKNYGCTHFIVGRDHAGPGQDSQNRPFYDPHAAQELAMNYADELGITILPFPEMVYIKEQRSYALMNDIKPSQTVLNISGTQLREKLRMHQPIPEWFSYPEIIQELRKAYPRKNEQGFTLFFTGLSGSGKSTLAQALKTKLALRDKRSISILDGDLLRHLWGNKLGFSREDRNLNIDMISFIAAEITQAGGIAICAAIAPYHSAREKGRRRITQYGGFIELYISTPLGVCEQRDTKGLYAKARVGKVQHMTGIDDQYEVPNHPEIAIDTSKFSIEESVMQIIAFLEEAGYLNRPMSSSYHNTEGGGTRETVALA